MTLHRMVELLEIEKECVRRNCCGECNRACHICDLLQDDTELHEMYAEVIARMKAQEQKCRGCGEATSKAIQELKTKLQAQEPRLVTEADFENADPYGYLPVWVEDKDDDEIICDCITKHAITEPDEDYHYRYWTSRPDEKRRAETPWDC